MSAAISPRQAGSQAETPLKGEASRSSPLQVKIKNTFIHMDPNEDRSDSEAEECESPKVRPYRHQRGSLTLSPPLGPMPMPPSKEGPKRVVAKRAKGHLMASPIREKENDEDRLLDPQTRWADVSVSPVPHSSLLLPETPDRQDIHFDLLPSVSIPDWPAWASPYATSFVPGSSWMGSQGQGISMSPQLQATQGASLTPIFPHGNPPSLPTSNVGTSTVSATSLSSISTPQRNTARRSQREGAATTAVNNSSEAAAHTAAQDHLASPFRQLQLQQAMQGQQRQQAMERYQKETQLFLQQHHQQLMQQQQQHHQQQQQQQQAQKGRGRSGNTQPPPAAPAPPANGGVTPLTHFGLGDGFMFQITLRRADGVDLGLSFDRVMNDRGLKVTSILRAGTVEAWNRQCGDGQFAWKAIAAKDTIVMANQAMSCDDMLTEIRSKLLLQLTIVRQGVPLPAGAAAAPAAGAAAPVPATQAQNQGQGQQGPQGQAQTQAQAQLSQGHSQSQAVPTRIMTPPPPSSSATATRGSAAPASRGPLPGQALQVCLQDQLNF